MTTILQDDKYFENEAFNEQYIKVINDDSPSSTFDMGDSRYYDDLTYDAHFKKVMENQRETFDLPDGKYYEDDTFNSNFKNIFSTESAIESAPESTPVLTSESSDDTETTPTEETPESSEEE